MYLGIYTGNSAGVYTGFLGTSVNTVDFSTIANGTFVAFNFTGLNVTADNVPGSGSGLLYFGFQSGTTDSGGSLLTEPMHRIDGSGGSITDYGNLVMAFGGTVSNRPLEFQAVVTPVPEPTTMALIGLSGASLLITGRRRHS